MSVDYGLLKTLHRMLRQLTDLDERIRKGPIKIRIVENNEKSFTATLEEVKKKLTDLTMACKAKTMQLGEREAKVEDHNKKLNECDSNKEFQLLKDRIAADLQANSVLQDEILEQLERIDVLTAEVAEAKSNLEKAKTESNVIREKVELELSELKSEKTRISAELAEEEKKLPDDMLVDYRRLVAGKGEDALGKSNTEICGNCNQTLTTQQANQLLMKKPMNCKGCGCIMYVDR